MITDRREFTNKITLYGFIVSISTIEINSKCFAWPVHSVEETSPNFLRRPTRVGDTADSDDITQSQAVNHHRL